MQIQLPLSLFPHWQTEASGQNLLTNLAALDSRTLKLTQFARGSALFDEEALAFSLLSEQRQETGLYFQLSLFYREMDTTCPCSGEENDWLEGHTLLRLFFAYGSDQIQLEYLND